MTLKGEFAFYFTHAAHRNSLISKVFDGLPINSGYKPIKFGSTQFERHFLHAFDVTGKCACVLKIETRGQNGIKSTDRQTGESNTGEIRYSVARSVYIACGLENGQAKTQH